MSVSGVGSASANAGGLSKTVQRHIESMYGGSLRCAESNTWLTAFVERAPEAWGLLLELLGAGAATTENAKFFACQGLYLRLADAAVCGEDIWKACGDAGMGQNVLSTVFSLLITSVPPLSTLVGRRLCLVLVHLILRIGLTENWKDPIADVFRAMSSQQNMLCLVEVLTLLPVELETNRYCSPERIVLVATALRRFALPRVLGLTKQLLCQGGAREQRAAWKCLVGWCQSSARVALGTPLLVRLRQGHQRLCFERADQSPTTPAIDASTDASGVMPHAYAESLGLTLVEFFQSGIGVMALKAMASAGVGGAGSALDIDMFSDIIETFSEILLNPSPSSLDQWFSRDRSRVLYDAHCACLRHMLELFLRRWRRLHVASANANTINTNTNASCAAFFRGGILEGEHGGTQYTSRVLALLSIVGEHHRGAWLRYSGPQGDRSSVPDAVHLVLLMLTCTEHPHPKVATEALQFWDMFTDLRTDGESTPWAPAGFMQWLAGENVLIRVLGSIIKGCTLPSNSAHWVRDDLSEEREAYEEYRLHALDTLHTVASAWPLHMDPHAMSSMVCATHLGGAPHLNTIEAVFWIVGGIIEATDALEDVDYDSDEYASGEQPMPSESRVASVVIPSSSPPMFGAFGDGTGIAAGPWTELLKYIATVVTELHDQSSPYLINSSARLVSRVMPIIAQNPEFAAPLLFHLCSKALVHDTSRVIGAEVFFELCGKQRCALQIIRTDPSLTQTASILFAPRNLPGRGHVCLMQHLRAFPVSRMRVIDAFVSLQMRMPLKARLPLARSTIQQLVDPLSSATQRLKASSLAVSAASASMEALRQKNVASEMIERDLRALSRGILSIPLSPEGVTMIQHLVASVLHPVLQATDSSPSVVQGVSEIYKRISNLLEMEEAAQLKGTPDLASTFINDICVRFCAKPNAAWLSALASFVTSCRDMLSWPYVIQALGTMSRQIPNEQDASCSALQFEWVCLMDTLRRNVPRALLQQPIGGQLLLTLKAARTMSLGLCFPLRPASCPAHRSKGSILAGMVDAITFTVSVAGGLSEEINDLHSMCVHLFSRSLMVFTRASVDAQPAQPAASNVRSPSMRRWNRVPFSSAVAKVVADLLRGGSQRDQSEKVQQLAQSAFQQALASELPSAFAPVVLSDQMQRRMFDTLCQASNAASSHKAKRLVQQCLREIQDFCKLEPQAKVGAVSKLSFFR